MINPKTIFNLLYDNGISLFTGVPDSLLKEFCAYVSDHTTFNEHLIAANEGNAIAIASGHFLGTGKPALVYMQNSGLGNAINPLLSLADHEVYSIPMILMIGWRGEPGVKDEPQHIKQGRCLLKLLEAIELPYYLIDANTNNLKNVITKAVKEMYENMAPVAIVVRKGTFDKYALQKIQLQNFTMNREDAIKSIVDHLVGEEILVCTTGMASRELYEYRASKGDSNNSDFLTVGSMGHASSISMAIARAQPSHRVICIDGDGSIIMHMGSLAIIGQSQLQNLTHIVLNNGAHDSVGGQPTIGYNINFVQIAQACGYKSTSSVDNPENLKNTLTDKINSIGPVFLEICINRGSRSNLGRPKNSPIQNRIALMQRFNIKSKLS